MTVTVCDECKKNRNNNIKREDKIIGDKKFTVISFLYWEIVMSQCLGHEPFARKKNKKREKMRKSI